MTESVEGAGSGLPVTPDQVEFFAFLFGMWKAELDYLSELIASFPYFASHRLNVVDMSEAVRRAFQENPGRLFIDPRSCLVEPEYTFSIEALSELLAANDGKLRRIVEPTKLFHGQVMNRALTEYASKRFVVLMDSDIRFLNNAYLSDVVDLCAACEPTELAAVGMLYQKQPFYPTLNSMLDLGVHRRLLMVSEGRSAWAELLKALLRQAYRRARGDGARGRSSRFPRLHPALLMVNREVFIAHEMSFHNLYLDVLESRSGRERRQKIVGDNGASFLYQCASAGKSIVNIDVAKYVAHAYKGSRADAVYSESRSWEHGNLHLPEMQRV